MIDHVCVLGAGYTGRAVAEQARARGLRLDLTVRSDERRAALERAGFTVHQAAELDADRIARWLTPSTLVVIAFPPDGHTDQRIAQALSRAASVRYVSSTGVYPRRTIEDGPTQLVDDTTEVSSAPDPMHAAFLQAEAAYRAIGATVLRSPAIYGRDRGLHRRVIAGKHTIAGDGANVLSRIHVEDLATLLLARPEIRGETFVVGDGGRETQAEVIAWICNEHAVPTPPSVPAAQAPPSLRGHRVIDPSRALTTLGVTLRWPSFREGMARIASQTTAD